MMGEGKRRVRAIEAGDVDAVARASITAINELLQDAKASDDELLTEGELLLLLPAAQTILETLKVAVPFTDRHAGLKAMFTLAVALVATTRGFEGMRDGMGGSGAPPQLARVMLDLAIERFAHVRLATLAPAGRA